eukprot:c18852_g1_i1.p1 GENE.c18852_g1_i1~~c18852_g1_i1.p1  ORF type:complete len:228 (-),score=90.72 c18852_g1_i1:8-691(-)
MTRVFLGFSILFTIALLISSIFSARQCYVTPCYQGYGLDVLWSIDNGLSFQVIVIALTSILQMSLAARYFFHPSSEQTRGLLVGFTGALSFFLVTQAIVWGQQSILVDDLDHHLNGYQYYQESPQCNTQNSTECSQLSSSFHCTWVTNLNYCLRAMPIDESAKAKFNSVTIFSILLAFSQAAFAYFISQSKDVVENESSVIGQQKNINIQDDQDMSSLSYQTENVRL